MQGKKRLYILIWNLCLDLPLTQIKIHLSSHTGLPLKDLTLLFHLPTSLPPPPFFAAGPSSALPLYTVYYESHRTWQSEGLWRISALVGVSQKCCSFFFFCNIRPNLSPETALLTHPARHPCQPPQVEPQASPHVCIIVTSVFSLTNDPCFKILARN